MAPLVRSMLADDAGPSASVELSTAVKSVGEKLVTLLQSLNSDDVSPYNKAALSLKDEAGFDADLKVALAKLTNPTPKLNVSAEAPVLATPALKLTEPSLTGKADPAVSGAPGLAIARNDNTDSGAASADSDGDNKSDGGRHGGQARARPRQRRQGRRQAGR